eukprot:1151905-Pelagomonas_calceolata.AAC.5
MECVAVCRDRDAGHWGWHSRPRADSVPGVRDPEFLLEQMEQAMEVLAGQAAGEVVANQVGPSGMQGSNDAGNGGGGGTASVGVVGVKAQQEEAAGVQGHEGSDAGHAGAGVGGFAQNQVARILPGAASSVLGMGEVMMKSGVGEPVHGSASAVASGAPVPPGAGGGTEAVPHASSQTAAAAGTGAEAVPHPSSQPSAPAPPAPPALISGEGAEAVPHPSSQPAAVAPPPLPPGAPPSLPAATAPRLPQIATTVKAPPAAATEHASSAAPPAPVAGGDTQAVPHPASQPSPPAAPIAAAAGAVGAPATTAAGGPQKLGERRAHSTSPWHQLLSHTGLTRPEVTAHVSLLTPAHVSL